jgi:hypothetical protein
MAFDIAGARAAGYSDDEIADYLSADKSIKFDVAGAREAGYSPGEILEFIGTGSASTQSRSWGQAAADTAVQLGEGVNTILGAVPNLVAPEGETAEFFNRGAEYWRDKQSDPLKAKIATADQAITAAGDDGVMSQIAEAASQYFTDPALAARFVTTNLPSMIPGIGVAKVAQAAALAKGASAARAAQVATTAGGLTNAALNAGGARGEAFDDIKNTLKKQGLSEEDATDQALQDSRLVAAVGAATGYISGKTGLEKAITGGVTKGGIRTGLVSAATEIAGEQIEEVSPKLATNMQASQYDNRSIGKDVGRTIVETAIGSGPGAVVSGVMATRKLEDIGKATSVDEAIATASEVLDTPPLQIENKPDPLISFPDGTVGRQSEVDAFIKSLPENEQVQARATMLGMGPQDIKPGDVRETLRERDFVPEPSGSFGMVNEFADMMNQEKSDLERRRSGTDTELESLVSAERADVEQRRAGLIDAAIGNQIADVDAQAAANREHQAQQNRLAVMDQVIGSEAAIGINPAQLSQAFTQALTEQGYANATPTAQESARIERAAMARDAMLESEQPVIEPSAPNEMDVAALVKEKKPKPVSSDPLSRVKNLTAQGYTLQGKQLQGPAGDKINLSRAELLYVKAQRKGASNDGNTTATNLSGRDVGATGAQTADPVLGDAAPGTETVPQPDPVGQADPAPAAVPGRADDSSATIPADQQPALITGGDNDSGRQRQSGVASEMDSDIRSDEVFSGDNGKAKDDPNAGAKATGVPKVPGGTQELTEDADTGEDIPVSYFKKVKVDYDVYIEDEQRSETTKVPAKEALASVREDIDNYRTLLNCLRG